MLSRAAAAMAVRTCRSMRAATSRARNWHRLAERTAGGKRVRFRPSTPFEESLLTRLPEVSSLEHDGGLVVVTGEGDLANAVILTLAKVGVSAHDLAMESGALEDAFLALTGRGIGKADHEASQAEGVVPRDREHRAFRGWRAVIRRHGPMGRHRRWPPSGGSSRTSGTSPFGTRPPWSGAWVFRSFSWRSSGACQPRPSRTPRSGGSASSRSTCPS